MRGVHVVRRLALTSQLGAALAALVLVAGCTGGASPSAASPVSPAVPTVSAAPTGGPPTAAPTPSDIAPPDATPTPAPASPAPSPADVATPGPIPAKPPVATLRGLSSSASARGQLGSYTWGRGGSDAPWIVGKVLGSAAVGAALDVSLEGTVPTRWTAAWAAVSDGMAGSPSLGTSGSGQVAVAAPVKPGDWSLRVTATFGPGHNATYFWRLSVTN